VIEHGECAPGRAVVAVRGDAVPTAGFDQRGPMNEQDPLSG
jgi:hypothetical protein